MSVTATQFSFRSVTETSYFSIFFVASRSLVTPWSKDGALRSRLSFAWYSRFFACYFVFNVATDSTRRSHAESLSFAWNFSFSCEKCVYRCDRISLPITCRTTIVRLILRIFRVLLCFHRCDSFNPPITAERHVVVSTMGTFAKCTCSQQRP